MHLNHVAYLLILADAAGSRLALREGELAAGGLPRRAVRLLSRPPRA